MLQKESFPIAKIHVPIVEHAGKMYFASHDFSDPKQQYRDIFDDLENHRGAHIYAEILGGKVVPSREHGS